MNNTISLKEIMVEKGVEQIFDHITELSRKKEDGINCYLDFDKTMLYVSNIYDLLEEKKCLYLLKDALYEFVIMSFSMALYEQKEINIKFLLQKSYIFMLYTDKRLKDNVNFKDICKLSLNTFFDIKSYEHEENKQVLKGKVKALKKHRKEC